MRDREKCRGKKKISEFTWFEKCPNGEEVESVAKKIKRSMVKRRVVILREKGVMENGKTEAGVGENVSLPSSPLDPAEKGETGRREEGRSEWLEIERKVSKGGGSEEERHTRRREGKKRQNRRNGSAGLSGTSFIFSPRLNIKDNLIIGGFSRTQRRIAHFLARLFVSLSISLHFPTSLPAFPFYLSTTRKP